MRLGFRRGDVRRLARPHLAPGFGPGLQHAKGRRDGDGWRLWCQGAFGSGCHNATWTLVHSGSSGVPGEDGNSTEKAFLIPREDFEIVDTWDSAGLRGSGSHDVKVDGPFIPEMRTLPMDLFGPCENFSNPTFRNPMQAHYNKGAVALGICRGAIDDLIELAATKTPWMFRLNAEGPARSAVPHRRSRGDGAGRARVPAGGAGRDRGAPRTAAGRWWPARGRKGRSCASPCSPASTPPQATRHIVDVVHNTAGTTASRMDHPLERRLRDAHQRGLARRHLVPALPHARAGLPR